MLKPMFVWALAVDSVTETPVVILKELDGERTLPIWIGLLEATAIASELGGTKLSSRPMAHDLLKNIIESVEVKVNKVVISHLKNHICYAIIYLDHSGKEIPVDARPSDALAVSLRTGAPIFAAEQVIRRAKKVRLKRRSGREPDQDKKWRDLLQSLGPEDFGEYKM